MEILRAGRLQVHLFPGVPGAGVGHVIKDTLSFRLVVYDGQAKQPLLDQIRGVRDGIVVVSIDDLGRRSPLASQSLASPRQTI